MADTEVAPNNKSIAFRGQPQRERPRMPWDSETISGHNSSLRPGSATAGRVANQANAILRSGAPEGVALATAFKHVNKLRKSGRVSERQGKRFAAKYGDTGHEIDASSR